MNSALFPSSFGYSPLESRADELASVLAAGLDDEFARQFKLAASDLGDGDFEKLVLLINHRLSIGTRKKNVKLVLSQKSESKTITVMDGSRFFGGSWSIVRQTFAM